MEIILNTHNKIQYRCTKLHYRYHNKRKRRPISQKQETQSSLCSEFHNNN